MVVNKCEIVRRMYEKSNGEYTIEHLTEFVDYFLDSIVDVIKGGDSIQFNGYMSLKIQHCKERIGRNVYENTEMVIPERYKVKIKAGSKLIKVCEELNHIGLYDETGDIDCDKAQEYIKSVEDVYQKKTNKEELDGLLELANQALPMSEKICQ